LFSNFKKIVDSATMGAYFGCIVNYIAKEDKIDFLTYSFPYPSGRKGRGKGYLNEKR
jgi:hypothetical protein